MWLQANNPFYADVAIDYESLQRLPEDGVPDDLPTVEDPESNEEQDAQQEDAENHIPHQSHSFLPLPQRQQTEQDAIVQGSPRVMIANCYGEHAPFGPAFRELSAFRTLHVSFEQDIAYFVDLIPGTNALATFMVNL